MIASAVLAALNAEKIPYREYLSTKRYSTIRVGGVAPLAIFPETTEQLSAAVRILRGAELPVEFLGNGSNVFFADGDLKSVLLFTKGLNEISVEGDRMTAMAGASLAALTKKAAEESLTGLEFAAGIPGTVGGAIFMNAGAYGSDISAVLTKSVALDTETGEPMTLTDHAFGYRRSIYMKKKNWICLGGSFLLAKGDRNAIRETMRELAVRRRETQPLEYPNAGSYFKRPEGDAAGRLIDVCGLKGLRVGDAAVSEKHAGFMINLGSATAEDLLRLEEMVRDAVHCRFGITLEREVRFIR